MAYQDTPYKGSEAYKSVIGATVDQLITRRPYTVNAIACHRQAGNAGQVAFFEGELALIDELLIKGSRQLGSAAFKRGVKSAPRLDKDIMVLVAALSSPDFSNSQTIIKLMESWSKGWNSANLAGEV